MATPNPGLTRYGSAPGSFLAVLADSVVPSGGGGGTSANGIGSLIGSGSEPEPAATLPISCFFTAGGRGGDNLASCLSSESACCGPSEHHVGPTEGGGAQLMRHSSSPAGFFAHLMMDNGFSVSRGMGHYSQAPNNGVHTMPSTRLKSQLSFSRQEPLSQISEISIPEMGENTMGGNSSDENAGNIGQSYILSNYSIGSWDDTNSIAFSTPSRKRRKDSSDNLLASLGCLESQYSLPTTSLEMAAIDKLLQAQDSVAFKVRAKRGCATHPRSIAERERRTRISEELRKLQELVPNMDRQTSTSNMLVLAVQHIKELQKQAQVRREKISERMKYLQDLVPGCNNITGKASVLDEIINYVQSLHKQVELLSMKLAYVDPLIDCNKQSFMEKETGSLLMELDKETGHQKRITLLSKSADGSYFLTSSLDKSAKCSGECMRIIFPSKEKVHKQGIALGRSVDLTRFNGYDELIAELDQMFEFEGELMFANKSWMVVYTDSDGDMMLVGDDPWSEFCSMVRKINIYTKDEVQKMNPGALSPRRKETLNVIVEKLTNEETMSPLPSAASNTKRR